MKMRNNGTGKWYVTIYDKYPIFEPSEGGYFYAGIAVRESRAFNSRKKAMKALKSLYRECVKDGCTEELWWFRNNDFTRFGLNGKYIGEGWYIKLERTQGKDVCGRIPYC